MTATYVIVKAIVTDNSLNDEQKSDLLEMFLSDDVSEFALASVYGITL